tara:strand:+ start:8 stop:2686 length:2679 start_codon:yes stop_codon:yes gene_type:complete
MARIRYNPTARSRGFRPQQLSTAGIDRMREDSNRLIQGMERHRRAEKAERDKILQAMGENFKNEEEQILKNNQIELENLTNQASQKLANIQSEIKQSQQDTEDMQTILGAVSSFSNTAAKVAAQRTADMIRDQESEGLSAPIQSIPLKDVEDRIAAEAAQVNGAIQLDTEIQADGVLNNEPPAQTFKGYVANHGFKGYAAKANDNKVAEDVYNRLLTSRLKDSEKVYTAADGREFTGMEALGDGELMRELQQQTLKDVDNFMGFTDPLYLAAARKSIYESNAVQVAQADKASIDRSKAIMRQQANDSANDGTITGVTMGFARMQRVDGNAAAHDWHVKNVIGNPNISEEVADKLDPLNTGKLYSQQWPARWAEGIKIRNAAIVKKQNADDALLKAKDRQWVTANIDAIQQAYNDDPVQAAVFIKQRYDTLGIAPPSQITRIEREAIKRKKDILENTINQKIKFGNLDLTFVNSIADPELQKQARTALDAQEERKYGEGGDIKKGIMAVARSMTGFDVNAKGASPKTYMLHAAIEKRYLDNVKKYSSHNQAWTATQEEIKNESTDPSSVFYKDPEKITFFPNIETAPRERIEMNNYIDKNLLTMGRALVDKPFALANTNEMDAAYTSSLSGAVQYPPGIIRYADSTGVKPSEAFNAHRIANNAATGANKPLLTPSPASVLIDESSPKMRKLFLSDVPELINRGSAMVTGNLPMRSNMRQGSEFENMFLGIGVNEGTRTADGGFNDAYYGHIDPGDGAKNRGTISARSGTPEEADRNWTGILKNTQSQYDSVLEDLGAVAGSPEHKALMFNILDLRVQAPAAVESFVSQIPQILEAGISAESLGRARHNAFINPNTGRLDTTFPKETDSTSSKLLQDQMDRAMTLFTGQRGGSI